MTKYVAFLRGINSGKNPTVKMEVLRKTFEGLGLENVRTVLASGNVLFESSAYENKLEQKIEEALPVLIGFSSDVIVRTIDDLHKLVLFAIPHLRLKGSGNIDIIWTCNCCTCDFHSF